MRDDPEATELLPCNLQLVKAPSDFHGNCFSIMNLINFPAQGYQAQRRGVFLVQQMFSSLIACVYVCMYFRTCVHACHSAAVDMGGQLCGLHAQFSLSTLNWLLRIELRSPGLHSKHLYLPSRLAGLTKTFWQRFTRGIRTSLYVENFHLQMLWSAWGHKILGSWRNMQRGGWADKVFPVRTAQQFCVR